MIIKGNTNIFALLGNNLSHSLSPQIHNILIKSFKINAVYIPIEIQCNLKEFFQMFKSTSNFIGCNITIPFKEKAFFLSEYTDRELKKIKSVNTLLKGKNNRIEAYNTDVYGFIKSIETDLKFNAHNKEVVLFGAGGTAKTIIFSLLDRVKRITVVARKKDNIESILKNNGKILWKKFENNAESLCFPEADLIVNSTPLGLKGENIDINFKVLKKSCCFFDVLYVKSPLINIVENLGFKNCNGLNMLIYQAVKSFEIWTKLKINDKLIREIKKEVSI